MNPFYKFYYTEICQAFLFSTRQKIAATEFGLEYNKLAL